MAGFMAGFGTKFSELIEEDRKYYRDRAAKRQEYLQTYGTRAVADREGKANAALGVANYLITNGISKEDVRYVVDTSGVQGLAQLKATIDSRTDLTADEKSSLVKKAKDYVAENPDEDLNTVVKRAYGLYKSSDNPVKRERSLFGSILGLDSRMMEDEVMDDLYINGYTGRDIYRIMGSAGPRAGAALQLDLPTKPLSPTAQKLYADVMLDQMEAGIDARVLKLKTEYNKEGSDKMSLQKQIDALETLKGRGYDGIATYAKLDPSIFEYAKALNEDTPGSIVNNGFLYGFESAFNDYFEETRTKVKTKGSTDDDLGLPTGPVGDDLQPKPEPKVMTFKTAEEFNKAVEAGEVAAGQQVQIGNGSVSTFTPPEAEPKTTDLGDMTGAPGFRDMIEPNPELTLEERVKAKKDAAQGVIDAVDSNVASFTQTLDKGFASGALTANAYGNTLLGGVAQIVGADGAADFFYTQAVKSEDGADSTEGLVPAVNSILDKLGVPDYSEQDEPLVDLQSAVDAVMGAIPAIPKEVNGYDLDEALLEAPDHIEKLGDQAKEAWRRLTAEVTEEVTDEKPANVATRASDTPAYKQLQELLQERIALANKPAKVKKKKEEAIKKKAEKILIDLGDMSGAPGFRTEEVSLLSLILADELPERIVEPEKYNPRTVGTVGFQDLGLRHTTDDVRERQNQPPELQMSAARSPSPEADQQEFDSPRNMTVENFTTRGINATPRGLMTPKREEAPKLGQAEFGELIQRVHGSSKAAEAFNKKVSSGKLTAADVTRLIKATRKLPETASRQRLIASLFNLRDGLNKR